MAGLTYPATDCTSRTNNHPGNASEPVEEQSRKSGARYGAVNEGFEKAYSFSSITAQGRVSPTLSSTTGGLP